MSTAQPSQPTLDAGGAPLSNAERARGSSRQVALLAILILLVAVAVAAIHWPALSARALTFDDNEYLVVNPLVQKPSWNSAARFLREVLAPSTVEGYYQPLAMISLMLDFAQAKSPANLRPFHRTSLTLHVLNTSLVIVLLYLLFGQPWVAALVGLLFGVHPLTVEPIPWVGERKTLLATFFALWCFILYIGYVRRRNGFLYGAALGTFVLALLSKPTTTPLPALLLLLDYWPLRRLSWRTAVEKVPFFVIAAISAVITYLSQAHTAAVSLPQEQAWLRIPLILCHNIVFYLYKIVWPLDLSPHYPFPKSYSLSQPMLLAGVIGTALLIALLVISLRRTRCVLTGWLFFFVAILPTMQIIGFSIAIASDKYAYLPALGFLMILAYALTRGPGPSAPAGARTGRRVLVIVAVLSVAGLAAAGTRRQLSYWQTTEGLYRHMLDVTPDAGAVHYDLALELDRQGKIDEAIRHYVQALRAAPQNMDVYCNLAIDLAKQGRVADAIEVYREALRRKPDAYSPHYNLAIELSKQGKIEEAAEHFAAAVQADPRAAPAAYNLAVALAILGRVPEAIQQYESVLQLDPGSAEAHNNLGTLLASTGQAEAAARHFTEVVRLRPDQLDARMNLGVCWFNAGKVDAAENLFRDVLRTHPDFAGAYLGLGRVLEFQGKTDEAVKTYEAGLRRAPNDAQLRKLLDEARRKPAAPESP